MGNMRRMRGVICISMHASLAQAFTSTLPDDFAAQHLTASTCFASDPSFQCPEPMRPTSDYSLITGYAPISPRIMACPCHLIPPVVASRIITDLPTLCSLAPLPSPRPDCGRAETANALDARLVWHMSQLPVSACPARFHDAEGACGDEGAVQRFAPTCVLVTNSTGVQQVLDPFVPADRIWWESQAPGVTNCCTALYAEELVSTGIVACANRSCTFPEAVAALQSSCATSQPCGGLDLVSHACTRSDGTLSPDMSGCMSALVATPCEGGAPCLEPVPQTCAPTETCTECTEDICKVAGRLPSGQSCTYECPTPAPTYQLQHGSCDAPACGTKGSLTLSYIPCQGNLSVGCLAYPSPRNVTVPCIADVCPCAGVCEPELNETAPVFDANNTVCASGVLDMDGECCAQARDACGMCADALYEDMGPIRVGLDAAGKCCSGPRPVLTSSLVCCPDASLLDICGVCKGDSTSCWLAIGDPTSPLIARNQAANMSRVLGIAVKADASGQVFAPPGSGAALSRIISAFVNTADSAHSGTVSVQSRGVHGNGLCELGESPQEEPACALAYQTCPLLAPDPATGGFIGDPAQVCGGNGVCLRMARMCRCSFGYTGLTCGTCSPGFKARRSLDSDVVVCVPGNAGQLMDALNGDSIVGSIIAGVLTPALASVLAGIYAKKRRDIHALVSKWTQRTNRAVDTVPVSQV